jgi:hypothetical protein
LIKLEKTFGGENDGTWWSGAANYWNFICNFIWNLYICFG